MENNIINEIKNLKHQIVPRPEWIALNRDFLLREISSTSDNQKAAVGLTGYWSIFSQTFRQLMFEPALVMMLVLISFVGGSLTINAAFYSLPGDGLYKVKLALEQTHVALITDEEKKVELKMEFAQKRAVEFEKVVTQSNVSPEAKKKKIAEAVKEFKNNVSEVNIHLSKINQDTTSVDRSLSVKMALTISEQSQELAKNIDKTTSSLEEVDKKDLEDILAQAAQSVQDVNLTAKQMIDGAKNLETEAEAKDSETGIVEGVSNENETAVTGDSADINIDTKQAETKTDQQGEIKDGVEGSDPADIN